MRRILLCTSIVLGGLTMLMLLTVTLSVQASPFIDRDIIPNEGVSRNGDQPTSEPVPIRWFVGLGTGSDPGQLIGQQQVVADFNSTHPGISLTLEVVDNASAYETLLAEIAAGNPPDVVGPVGIHGANYFGDYWLDLEPLVVAAGYDLSDFDPALLDLFQTEEGFNGMPFLIYPSFIYYNEDLFDQAGLAYPPHQYGQPYTDTVYGGDWTVEKLEEIGMLLTLDDSGKNATDPIFDPGNIVQFGYMNQWPTDLRGEATLFGAGSFVDGNGDAQIPDHWRAAVQWYYSGMWENVFIPNDPYANSAWFSNGNVFNSGHLAMMQNHLWYAGLSLNNVSNWDIAAVPSYSETVTAKLNADTIRILNSTQYPNEAFEVLAYLTTDAVTSLVLTYGGYPARISEQPAALTNLSLTYPGVDWQVMVDSIAFLDDPSHEGYMPRYQEAYERILEFQNLYRGTAGLDIDSRLDELRDDLQWIFNRQEVYLPMVTR